MAKEIRIEMTDEQYERYRRAKDWNGLTWREVIERGIDTLDVPDSPQNGA